MTYQEFLKLSKEAQLAFLDEIDAAEISVEEIFSDAAAGSAIIRALLEIA